MSITFARNARVPLAAGRLRRAALLTSGLATALVAAPLGAATIFVTTDQDTVAADGLCSLREAITAANGDLPAGNGCLGGSGDDRVRFVLPLPATIALTSNLPAITDRLKIQGPGAGQLAIDGVGLFRLLSLDDPAGNAWLGVEDLTLTRGLAASGGGAEITNLESALFRRVLFLDNSAGNGGGLSASADSVVEVEDCWFTDNLADGPAGGGGLLLNDGALVTVRRSTFSGNSVTQANASGGAVVNQRAALTLDRVTVSGNTAVGSVGGVYAAAGTGPATLSLREVTVFGNVSDTDDNGGGSDAGGLMATVGVGQTMTVELENSIIAGNQDGGVLEYPDVFLGAGLTLVTSGFNLIGQNTGSQAFFAAGLPNAAGDYVGTTAAPIDPQLEALAPYGGLTPSHRPSLAPLSPAVDTGSCPTSPADQRGFGDPAAFRRRFDLAGVPNGPASDGCDIGAHERNATAAADPALFRDGFELGTLLTWSGERP